MRDKANKPTQKKMERNKGAGEYKTTKYWKWTNAVGGRWYY